MTNEGGERAIIEAMVRYSSHPALVTESARELAKLQEIPESLPLDPRLPEHWNRTRPVDIVIDMLAEGGSRLVNEGHDAEAMPVLRRLLELAPLDPDGHRELSVALSCTGRKVESLRHCDLYTRLRPNEWEGFVGCFDSWVWLNDTMEAERSIGRAHDLAPEAPPVVKRWDMARQCGIIKQDHQRESSMPDASLRRCGTHNVALNFRGECVLCQREGTIALADDVARRKTRVSLRVEAEPFASFVALRIHPEEVAFLCCRPADPKWDGVLRAMTAQAYVFRAIELLQVNQARRGHGEWAMAVLNLAMAASFRPRESWALWLVHYELAAALKDRVMLAGDWEKPPSSWDSYTRWAVRGVGCHLLLALEHQRRMGESVAADPEMVSHARATLSRLQTIGAIPAPNEVEEFLIAGRSDGLG